jgi:hypothetical protein
MASGYVTYTQCFDSLRRLESRRLGEESTTDQVLIQNLLPPDLLNQSPRPFLSGDSGLVQSCRALIQVVNAQRQEGEDEAS